MTAHGGDTFAHVARPALTCAHRSLKPPTCGIECNAGGTMTKDESIEFLKWTLMVALCCVILGVTWALLIKFLIWLKI